MTSEVVELRDLEVAEADLEMEEDTQAGIRDTRWRPVGLEETVERKRLVSTLSGRAVESILQIGSAKMPELKCAANRICAVHWG
jgi:hypothetical protein